MCVLLLCTRGQLGWRAWEPQSNENRALLRNDGNTLGLGGDGCPNVLSDDQLYAVGHLNDKFCVYFVASKGSFLNTDMKISW